MIDDNFGFWLFFPAEAKRILIKYNVFYRHREWREIIADLKSRKADSKEIARMNAAKVDALRKCRAYHALALSDRNNRRTTEKYHRRRGYY